MQLALFDTDENYAQILPQTQLAAKLELKFP